MTSIRYRAMPPGWRDSLWLVAMGAPLAWWWLPGEVAGFLFLPLWVGVAQVMFAGLLEAARLRRRAWLGQYLAASSPWQRWLRGGVVMVIWQQLLGAVLALVLLVSLRGLAATDWPLLLLAPVLFVAFGRWLEARLARHVIADYLPSVTRRLAVAPVAGVLALGLVLMALWRPQPYLVDVSWQAALGEHLVAGAGQSLLGALERVASALELSGLWAMQNALENLGVRGAVAALGWAALLLMQGALAWSFVRLLAGVGALCHRRSVIARHVPPLRTPDSQSEEA